MILNAGMKILSKSFVIKKTTKTILLNTTPLNIIPTSYVMRSERSGLGLAPFDPDHNSTALLVGEDLYAGTVADLSGVDPIIFR